MSCAASGRSSPPLALMLPLGAFVAGTLVASAADDPAPRDTVIIQREHDVAQPTRPPSEPDGRARPRSTW